MAQGSSRMTSSEGSSLPAAVDLPQVPVSMPASLEVARGDALDLAFTEDRDLAKDFTEEGAAVEAAAASAAALGVDQPAAAAPLMTSGQEEEEQVVQEDGGEEEEDESADETQPVYLVSGWSSSPPAHLARRQEEGGTRFALPQPHILASPALAASLSAAELLTPQSSTSSHGLTNQPAPMPQEGLSSVAVEGRSAEPDTDTIVQRI